MAKAFTDLPGLPEFATLAMGLFAPSRVLCGKAERRSVKPNERTHLQRMVEVGL